MADYAIGDVQGCFDSLQGLLERIQYNDRQDRLWFVGDLVNRGPQSLAVLRFVKNLAIPARVCLGNHDLHLLSMAFTDRHDRSDLGLQQVLHAEDCEELCTWLSRQSLLCFDPELNVAMVHAGIAPIWTFEQAQVYAHELEMVLRSPERNDFLHHMYGNKPNLWTEDTQGISRLRLICNYFTRMRFCFADGSLDFEQPGPLHSAPSELYPWYATPNRQEIEVDIVFGHWAALAGQCAHPRIHAIDTGCVWGKTLTALRLQDKHRISVPSID